MMPAATHIDIATLRAQVNQLLDLFAAQGIRSVPVEKDFYWAVPWGSENVGKEAVEPSLVIGSLADDVEFLAGTEDEPVALMLCHVAPVLHHLGQNASKLGVF